jgi:predicted small metal-binding protein
MEEKALEILAKKAYETHIGCADIDPECYFKVNAYSWAELPPSTKQHWIKIVRAVVLDSWDIDMGDLV